MPLEAFNPQISNSQSIEMKRILRNCVLLAAITVNMGVGNMIGSNAELVYDNGLHYLGDCVFVCFMEYTK